MERRTLTERIAKLAFMALFCTNVAAVKAAEPTITITSIPPIGQHGNAQGKVVWDGLTAYNAEKYAVIAMLHAIWDGGGGYYVKPYDDKYLNPVDPDGSFSILITTGGIDADVDEVLFYFVERANIKNADVAGPATMAGKYLATKTLLRSEEILTQPLTSNIRPGVVRPGTKITLQGGGTIRYSLDGSDPTTSSTAKTYNNDEFTVPATGSLLVKAAVKYSDTSFSQVYSLLWLPEEQLNTPLWGLCVSLALNGEPFGMQLSEEKTLERMKPVAKLTKWIRTFSTINNGNEYINRIGKEMGLRTMIGLYITNDISANEKQIEGLKQILDRGPEPPDLICVGNETSLAALNPTILATSIEKARDMLLKRGLNIPIGTSEIANISLSNSVLEKLDFLGVNIYCGTWDNVSESQMFSATKQTYDNTLSAYPSTMILITECGTPYNGSTYAVSGGTQTPSVKKASAFLNDFCNWIKQDHIPSFYFEAYDEKVKALNHPIEQYFGLMNENLEIHSFYRNELVSNDMIINPETDLQINPSLFTDRVTITGAEGATLTILTESGAIVRTHRVENSIESIRLDNLPSGMYLFGFEKNNQIRTVKAIKR